MHNDRGVWRWTWMSWRIWNLLGTSEDGWWLVSLWLRMWATSWMSIRSLCLSCRTRWCLRKIRSMWSWLRMQRKCLRRTTWNDRRILHIKRLVRSWFRMPIFRLLRTTQRARRRVWDCWWLCFRTWVPRSDLQTTSIFDWRIMYIRLLMRKQPWMPLQHLLCAI